MNILIEPIYIGIIQAFISLILLSGFLFVGRLINSKIFINYNNLLFDLLISVIFLSQILKIFSYLNFFKETNFIFSGLLISLGLFNLKYLFSKLKKNSFYIPKDIFELLLVFTLLTFFIISISPPSMADALDYHYGVPLYLLNYNEVPSVYFWIHGALANNGEFINTLAIFLGSDNFGSLLQYFSLICFLVFLKGKVQSKKKLIFIYIFILCSPTLLQLISGPKFLLFPQILTATAIFLILDKKKIQTIDFIFICILLMGSSQFKLSFLLSGVVLGLVLFYKAFKINKINTIFSSILLFLFFLSPTIFWNYSQLVDFHLQNIFSSVPNEMINSIQKYRENNYIFPFNLLIPSSLGKITTILGFQFFILFLIFKRTKELNFLISITLVVISLHYFLSLNISRIYYEFILWLAVGFYFTKDKNNDYLFFSKLIIPQMVIVLGIASYFAIITLPSIFSNEYRDKFMSQNAYEYESIKWVNKTLPKDAKVISDLRSVSLYKNEFIPTDWLKHNIPNNKLSEYLNIIQNKKFNFIVLKGTDNNKHTFHRCFKGKFAASPQFIKSTRNPFNRNQKYSISIFEFNHKNIKNCVK